jgi:hypothetical protein
MSLISQTGSGKPGGSCFSELQLHGIGNFLQRKGLVAQVGSNAIPQPLSRPMEDNPAIGRCDV